MKFLDKGEKRNPARHANGGTGCRINIFFETISDEERLC